MKTLYISLGIGIIGFILLILTILINDLICPRFLLPLHSFLNNILNKIRWKVSWFGYIENILFFSFLIVIPISILGIILGTQFFLTQPNKTTIFVVVLNFFNLLLSFFITWLLIGVGRGF